MVYKKCLILHNLKTNNEMSQVINNFEVRQILEELGIEENN